MTVEAKICGITSADAVTAATEGGARFVGFVFYEPSPRNLTLAAARGLAAVVPSSIRKVGLFVDAVDTAIAQVLAEVPLDVLQLHGEEPPERIAAIRKQFGLPVMKAIRIGVKSDVAKAASYLEVADRLLFDAKGPAGGLPGGTGQAFDWKWLSSYDGSLPWMLSGGLNASNVKEAVRQSGARAVDVSSGVEDKPGHKDPGRIAEFLSAVADL
ncbi:MAG: phosphoribosylanthranilate isomerase [Alphaproteobacteria bacterium]|nr:phosphoribosylanthranilate isomerase [Alphaproteobacteria bacterium]